LCDIQNHLIAAQAMTSIANLTQVFPELPHETVAPVVQFVVQASTADDDEETIGALKCLRSVADGGPMSQHAIAATELEQSLRDL